MFFHRWAETSDTASCPWAQMCVCVCGTCSGEEKGHCIRCSEMGIEISLKTHKGGGIIKASLSTTEHLPVEHLPPEHQELVS